MDILYPEFFLSLDKYIKKGKINRTSYPSRLDFIKTNK